MARKFSGATRRARGTGPTMIQQSRSVSAAEKAAYHTETGAGRSHIKRQFFGLTAADEQAIADRVEQAIGEAIKEA